MRGGIPVPKRKSDQKFSPLTVERMTLYRRHLEYLESMGRGQIFSHELARMIGITPAQLRRDLATFGSFGNIAKGYEVSELKKIISGLLGTQNVNYVALLGVGNLGRTLLSYKNFLARGFSISVCFDTDPNKVNRHYAGVPCLPLDQLEEKIKASGIKLAIIATSPQGLQELVNRLISAGVVGILNFVPYPVQTPAGVFVEPIDISAKLEKLSFLSRNEVSGP
jgi:redox-sensing transcriptional repressor